MATMFAGRRRSAAWDTSVRRKSGSEVKRRHDLSGEKPAEQETSKSLGRTSHLITWWRSPSVPTEDSIDFVPKPAGLKQMRVRPILRSRSGLMRELASCRSTIRRLIQAPGGPSTT